MLFYASYPANNLVDRTDLIVTSIYGTRDGLAGTGKFEEVKAILPPQTQYVVIEGGNHAYFGDYGKQDGDGEATISREDAAAQIVAATITFMDSVAGS